MPAPLQQLKDFLRWVLRWKKPRPPTARQVLGRRAESEAARLLKKRGYKILERNFRVTEGEIDLVVFQDGTIAFVEVRARTMPSGLDALDTVRRTKRRRIIRAAQRYVSLRGLSQEDVRFRFDLVAVRCSPDGAIVEMEHIEDAFHE